MIVNIAIHHNGEYGSIAYDEGNQDVLIAHNNPQIRRVLYKYLTKKRDFDTPMYNDPSIRGGYLTKEARPVDSRDYMGMALSELYFNTGIHVDWDHPSTNLGDKDPNADADKPITKSIWDDTEFDIINE